MQVAREDNVAYERVTPRNPSLKYELCSAEISILDLALSCSGDRKDLIF